MDHDNVQDDNTETAWPGGPKTTQGQTFTSPPHGRSPPDPYDNVYGGDYNSDRGQSNERSPGYNSPPGKFGSPYKSPPGPYDSPYESPPGPYDSPSEDEDEDYGPSPQKKQRYTTFYWRLDIENYQKS